MQDTVNRLRMVRKVMAKRNRKLSQVIASFHNFIVFHNLRLYPFGQGFKEHVTLTKVVADAVNLKTGIIEKKRPLTSSSNNEPSTVAHTRALLKKKLAPWPKGSRCKLTQV